MINLFGQLTSLGLDEHRDKGRKRDRNIDKEDFEFESRALKSFYKIMLHFFVPFLSWQFPQCSVKAKTEKNLETEHWSLLVLVEIAFPLWHAVKV